MTDDVHIRCSHCSCHLAGPLAHTQSSGNVGFDEFIVGFNQFLLVAEVQFSTKDLFVFRFESENDFCVHPQWYEGWRHNWPEFAKGAVTRRLFATTEAYGCCGPVGTVTCRCGTQLGQVMADCLGLQWMVFFESRIDRSDEQDGYWTFHSDADEPIHWFEDSGELVNNRRNGDWERWLVMPQVAPVKRRNKNREPVMINEERIDRRLVSVARWAHGELVCETAD